MTNQLCVHATIHGRVHGVGYRSWVERNAIQRGLTGWVRNRHDGTVEAVFCGEESAVEEMLKECERGPLAADVARIERKMPDVPPPGDFKQRATE
jgi:acylphosphatase